MCFKAMTIVMMVMLVMPVSPRPHQTQQGNDKIENAVSDSLKEIEAAIIGSAKKIKSAIEETVKNKMLEESGSGMEQHGNVVANTGNSALSEVNAKKSTAIKVNTFAKIFAAKRAAALKRAASSSVPSSVKVAEGGTTIVTTTTLDPLEEYCKEACEAGVGGPECDCPDHPIG